MKKAYLLVFSDDSGTRDQVKAWIENMPSVCPKPQTHALNPNGIPSISPGLARSDYPGSTSKIIINHNVVASCPAVMGCNSFRVDLNL